MRLSSGQVAVVTGAASGIGLAICRALGRRGLLIAALDVEESALAAAANFLRSEGVASQAFHCDVSDSGSVGTATRDVLEHFGAVDLLINNAGVGGALGPCWEIHENDWTWTVCVNLMGVVHSLRAFLPAMTRRPQAHVVNVASLAGLTAPPFLGPYVATKHAVVALTESLSAELRLMGTSVGASVACPGAVESRIGDSIRNRPRALAHDGGPDPALVAGIQAEFAKHVGGCISASEAAELILEGVEADRLHILTHRDSGSPILERLAAIGSALPQAREQVQ